jgi:hypothetical protein
MGVSPDTREELAENLYTALRSQSPIDRLTAEHDLSVASTTAPRSSGTRSG